VLRSTDLVIAGPCRYPIENIGLSHLWIALDHIDRPVAMALAIGLFLRAVFSARTCTATFLISPQVSSHGPLSRRCFGEASLTLVGSGNLIKSSQMPIGLPHHAECLQRNLIIALHNCGLFWLRFWPFVRWSLYSSAVLSLVGSGFCSICFLSVCRGSLP